MDADSELESAFDVTVRTLADFNPLKVKPNQLFLDLMLWYSDSVSISCKTALCKKRTPLIPAGIVSRAQPARASLY